MGGHIVPLAGDIELGRARVRDSVGITMVPLGRDIVGFGLWARVWLLGLVIYKYSVPLGRDIVGCHAGLPVQRLGRRDGLYPARLVRLRAGFGFGLGSGSLGW